MRKPWVPAEDEILRKLYPHNRAEDIAEVLERTVSSVYQRVNHFGLKKDPAFFETSRSGRLDGVIGGSTRFPKGHAPANKGLRRPGWSPGRMAQTQFKKGQLAGAAAEKIVPVGTEVVDRDGYIKRKVSDDAPPNMSRLNWKFVHVLVWEEHNGPLPAGYCVCFKNNNRADLRIENLECISRGERMRRNSYHTRYPKEVAQLIQLKGALNRKINRRSQTT